jgi:DNA-binding CsgD family transcriptional regulator
LHRGHSSGEVGHGAKGSEILDLLSSGEPPAYAIDATSRIIFWNRGAERVFGKHADEVLFKHCWEVVQGRDVFGNRFCHEHCSVIDTAKHGDSVRGYELVARTAGNKKASLSVTIIEVPGSRHDLNTIVHIIQPIDDANRLARLIEQAGGRRALANLMAPTPPPLTRREQEVLRWVASGLQNKEIAQKLGISLATVRNHIHNILDKLGVHSKLEAVSLAFRNSWITEPPAHKSPRRPD